MATTRVAVIAESPVMRAGLRALLAGEPGLVVVSASRSGGVPGDEGASPWTVAAATEADVVVWAASAPELAALLRDEDAPDDRSAALVLLAGSVDDRLARRAMAAGVLAVLPIDADEATVVAAVHAAAAGLLTLPRELAGALLDAAGAETSSAPVSPVTHAAASPLTAREREVLALLAQGLANKQIAPRLGITEHTVKAHVAAIYEKVGAGNRAEAAIAAARLGLLLL